MQRVLLAWMVLVLAPSLGLADPPGDENPWPGHVPGGRFYRDLEWGVTLWGPGRADQQLQTGVPGLLVRYIQSAQGRQPGWAINVLAARVREELPAEQMLARSAAQLRQGLGRRLENVMIQPGPADQPLVGRVSCRIAPDMGRTGPGTCRTYLYIRLRPLQYLTLVGESGPEAVDALNKALDELAGSARTFDPQAESRRLAEAAERSAALLGGVAVGEWAALTRRTRPQWLGFYRGAGEHAQPEGHGYLAVSAEHDRRIEAVLSTRLQVDGARLASFLSATTEQGGGGSETIRAWGSLTPPGGGSAEQTFCVARRDASGGALEVLDRTLGGARPRQGRHQAQIRGGPYLDYALLGPAVQRMAQAPDAPDGTLFGLFCFSPEDGQVVFQTFQRVGPQSIRIGGRQVEAVKWLFRPSVGQPVAVRWTDPSGARLLRLEQSPDRWAEAVEEHTVPEPVRRALTTPPAWP